MAETIILDFLGSPSSLHFLSFVNYLERKGKKNNLTLDTILLWPYLTLFYFILFFFFGPTDHEDPRPQPRALYFPDPLRG